MKQDIWVKRSELLKGEFILDMKGKRSKPNQTVSSFRKERLIKPWEGRVVTRDGDHWDEDLSNRSDLYSMALVKRDVDAPTVPVQYKTKGYSHSITVSAFDMLGAKVVDGMTGYTCLNHYTDLMQENKSKFKLTKAQKELGSMMWSAQLKEKKAAQVTADASKEISVICENQYADGDEW